MGDEKKECAKLIYDSSGWHRYPCSKPAKYHEDGKDWCGTHLPSRVRAKQRASASAAEREAEWAAKQAAREHEAALAAAREAVIQAAKAWAVGFVSTTDTACRDLAYVVGQLNKLETKYGAG